MLALALVVHAAVTLAAPVARASQPASTKTDPRLAGCFIRSRDTSLSPRGGVSASTTLCLGTDGTATYESVVVASFHGIGSAGGKSNVQHGRWLAGADDRGENMLVFLGDEDVMAWKVEARDEGLGLDGELWQRSVMESPDEVSDSGVDLDPGPSEVEPGARDDEESGEP